MRSEGEEARASLALEVAAAGEVEREVSYLASLRLLAEERAQPVAREGVALAAEELEVLARRLVPLAEGGWVRLPGVRPVSGKGGQAWRLGAEREGAQLVVRADGQVGWWSDFASETLDYTLHTALAFLVLLPGSLGLIYLATETTESWWLGVPLALALILSLIALVVWGEEKAHPWFPAPAFQPWSTEDELGSEALGNLLAGHLERGARLLREHREEREQGSVPAPLRALRALRALE